MPEDFRKAIESSPKEDAKEIGIESCFEQSTELMAAGVPSLHFYTMSKSQEVKKICEAILKKNVK